MPKFVPRQRKHRVIARQKAARKNASHNSSEAATEPSTSTSTDFENGDTNALEIHETTKSKHEAQKLKLREELQASQPKMSAKKQKRLDKYIETKLRKDENVALLKRLEKSQGGVDTALFQSTRRLGQRTESRRDMLRRAVEERKRGVNIEGAEKVLFERLRVEESGSEEEEEGEGEEEVSAARRFGPTPTPVVVPKTGFGSGLKRPLEIDGDGRPVIKKRVRSKGKAVLIEMPPPVREEPEWTGFSDGSEMPSGSEEEDEELDTEGSEVSDDSEGEGFESSEESSGAGSEEESEEEEDDDEESEELDEEKAARKERKSAFKAWAEQARNEAIGFTPSTVIGSLPQSALSFASQLQAAKDFVPREPEQDPLPESLLLASEVAKDRKAHAVQVVRSEDIETARLALPILAEEQRIMEAVFNNDVVVVSGATGSGKTTQVPQFLYENGFGDPNGPTPGMIGITQPRRVAAVSMSKRVGEELGDSGKKVAHQIRFDTTVGRNTAIKFMTDGVLLREMSEDFSLKKYSAIIIDEAHERTVNTDILVSMMSRCVKTRRELSEKFAKTYKPLKLIIMSATLRVSDFRENSRLFSTPPPLVEAEGRQYEVTPHWVRKTSHDFVEEAFKKVSRGHRKLPPGGMLVFLTGQNEIRMLAKRLKETFPATEAGSGSHHPLHLSAAEMPIEAEDMEMQLNEMDDEAPSDDEYDGSDDEQDDPDADFNIDGEEAASETTKIHVLPLYSQLPSKEQLKIFDPPPENSRLIVLATNVAETSLTIPGIRYVFDSGRHKERMWDRAGVQTFKTTWISKASADQRMGRAGRTGPGHCYRLYSSAIYESAMPDFAEPEIYRTPLEGVVLQLKSMSIKRVDNFPFPTPPERGNIVKAERLLTNLGALDSAGRITKLGRELQNYPLNPRFAQILRLGVMYNCTALAVAMVAALDVPELIIPDNQLDLRTPSDEEDRIWTQADNEAQTLREKRRNAYNTAQAKLSRLDFNNQKVTPQSDALKLFAAVLEYSNSSTTDTEIFCREMFLREKGLRETTQLRDQLTSIIRTLNPKAAIAATISHTKLPKPTVQQIALLKQVVAAGFIDQIALRADCLPTPPTDEYRKPKRAIDVRYKTLFSSSSEIADDDNGEFVYIHPSSILSRLPVKDTPRFIIYQRLQRSSPAPGKKSRVRMFPLTPVSAAQVATLARGTGLLDVGKPIGKIGVLESVKGEERRECDAMLSLVGEGGGVGWPLCRKKVVQRRVPSSGWVVERWVD
jgi:ATP-dependent RNA helicase DHX37/DHR1